MPVVVTWINMSPSWFVETLDREYWTVSSGKPKITLNKKKFFKKESESIFIPKQAVHRIENLYNKPIKIMEAQIGEVLKESDIVRYQDIYGRIK